MDPSVPEKLASLLRLEIDAMASLREILVEESRALLEREPSALEAVVTAKNRQFKDVLRLEQKREALFSGWKPGDHTDLRSGAPEASRSERTLRILWERLLSLAEECRTLNRLNGATIELGYLHVRQALRLLSGSADSTHAYDAGGRHQEGPASRRLGQA